MGRLQAMEFANLVEEGQTSLDMALEWHLTANHYPPVPVAMVAVCKEAIRLSELGEYDEMVELPEGISWKDQTVAPVRNIVEAHHLEDFIQWQD